MIKVTFSQDGIIFGSKCPCGVSKGTFFFSFFFFTTWPIGVGGQNATTGQCDDQSSTQKKDIAAFSGSLLFNDEN